KDLGHAEDGADAVAEVVVPAGEDAVEEWLGGGALSAGIEEKGELGGGEEVGGGRAGEGAEFGFGFGLLLHAEEEVGELAAELDIGGIELEGMAKFGDEGVALGEQLAGELGGARLAPAGG